MMSTLATYNHCVFTGQAHQAFVKHVRDLQMCKIAAKSIWRGVNGASPHVHGHGARCQQRRVVLCSILLVGQGLQQRANAVAQAAELVVAATHVFAQDMS